jgi:Domain of unknown function (DUF4352)
VGLEVQKIGSLFRGHLRSRAVAACVALSVAAVLAGCATQTIVKTVPAVPVSGNSVHAAPSQSSTGSDQDAKLGDTLTLTGNGGEAIAVTVNQVMDPLQVSQYEQPDAGQRFIGVQITLKNVGSIPYSDAPSNGAALLSNINEQAKAQIVTGGPCGNDFQSSANIAPGDTQQGCIPFEMPTGQTANAFQFTLNSGFGHDTGQWSLAGAVTNGSASPTSSAGAANSEPSSTATNSSNASTSSPCNEGPCKVAGLPNQCSTGLASTQGVSCGLASNLFYEYFKAQQNGGDASSLSAWSPASKQYYSADCSTGDGVISCSVSGTDDPSAQVMFTQGAMSAYSSQQASSFAANHDLGPKG